MITCHDLMEQLGLMANIKCKVLSRDYDLVPINEPGNYLGKPNLSKCKTSRVVIQTSKQYSNREATE